MSESVQPEVEARCDECGRYGAFDFSERKLCAECYEHSGSCCPEFGKEAPGAD